jgi:biopolymer transport protein ExbD
MARRRQRRWALDGTELNLAAMLDMAFQLLMFFVLTFSPAPIESQIRMLMPSPHPVTGIGSVSRWPSASESGADIPAADSPDDRSITITVLGTPDGRVRDLAVDRDIVADLPSLGTQFRKAMSEAGSPCRVVLQVDANLQYQDLLNVIEICTPGRAEGELPVEKLTFVELRDNKKLR